MKTAGDGRGEQVQEAVCLLERHPTVNVSGSAIALLEDQSSRNQMPLLDGTPALHAVAFGTRRHVGTPSTLRALLLR